MIRIPTSIRAFFTTRQRSSGRSYSARPCLESLEQREVLSTLVLPQTNLPVFNATFNILENGQPIQVDEPVAGGNFLGTLNGNTPLTASYCVNIDLTIFPGSTYSKAVVTSDGTNYGAAVPHAGAISWLLTHLGPTATTPIEQDALQAAIWKTEYGTTFQLDPAYGPPSTNSEMAPIFQADLAALGNNTTPVGDVSWISPGPNPDASQGQGLVAIAKQQAVPATRTSLQSSIANPTFGQSVTLIATVTPANGLGTPTGSVTFMDGSQKLGTVPLTGDSAKFTTALLGPGNHTLTAIYGGSSKFDGSASSDLTLKVNAAATRVTLTSSADPAVFGQPVIFTAKVSVVAPGVAALSGTVTFKDGTTVLGTATVSNGQARLTTTKLSVGTHAITAVFQASSVDLAKSTSTALTQTIHRAATRLTVSSSAATVLVGQVITLTAKVSVLAPGVAIPSGIVTIKDGAIVLGTAVVTNGVAVFKMPKLAKGKYTLTVAYGGDAHCLGSTSAGLTEVID